MHESKSNGDKVFKFISCRMNMFSLSCYWVIVAVLTLASKSTSIVTVDFVLLILNRILKPTAFSLT